MKTGAMDAKITLSFNGAVAGKAKRYAKKNNASLNRLAEFLLDVIITEDRDDFYFSEIPVFTSREFSKNILLLQNNVCLCS